MFAVRLIVDRESVRQHEIRLYHTIVNVPMDQILFYLVHLKVCIDHFEISVWFPLSRPMLT